MAFLVRKQPESVLKIVSKIVDIIIHLEIYLTYNVLLIALKNKFEIKINKFYW